MARKDIDPRLLSATRGLKSSLISRGGEADSTSSLITEHWKLKSQRIELNRSDVVRDWRVVRDRVVRLLVEVAFYEAPEVETEVPIIHRSYDYGDGSNQPS